MIRKYSVFVYLPRIFFMTFVYHFEPPPALRSLNGKLMDVCEQNGCVEQQAAPADVCYAFEMLTRCCG